MTRGTPLKHLIITGTIAMSFLILFPTLLELAKIGSFCLESISSSDDAGEKEVDEANLAVIADFCDFPPSSSNYIYIKTTLFSPQGNHLFVEHHPELLVPPPEVI